jgi:hypothetical protein
MILLYYVRFKFIKTIFIILNMKLLSLVYIALMSHSVYSHIEMSDPPPRRSKFSSYYRNAGLVDYNLMAPINEGYSFPCKGYSEGPVTKIIDGNTISITLAGTTIHGGGHCQFGISTDDTTFLVLKTVIRNCLLDGMTYSFDLPNNLPNTKITVFWTWVNAIGNREYYMDCADVQLRGNSPQTIVNGKSLLVLNLPGYQTVPEFPNFGMYDGRELFDRRQNIQLTLRSNGNSQPVQPSQPPPPSPVPPSTISISVPSQSNQEHLHQDNTNIISPSIPRQSNEQHLYQGNTNAPPISSEPCEEKNMNNCNHGEMTCGKDNGFNTCVYGKIIWRACAPGTKCKEVSNSIICM